MDKLANNAMLVPVLELSLLEKIEYVKSKISTIFNTDGRQTLDFEGVIVMQDYPVISE
jgi:hypothetical protein